MKHERSAEDRTRVSVGAATLPALRGTAAPESRLPLGECAGFRSVIRQHEEPDFPDRRDGKCSEQMPLRVLRVGNHPHRRKRKKEGEQSETRDALCRM